MPDVMPYPWTIRGEGQLCQVLDVTMTNPYQALDFGTRRNDLHTIRNVFACPLKMGVYIDQCEDIGRIENVHFNPNFWTRMALEPGFQGDVKVHLQGRKTLSISPDQTKISPLMQSWNAFLKILIPKSRCFSTQSTNFEIPEH